MLDRGRRQSRREQSFFQQCLEQDSAYFPRSQDSHSFVQEIKPHIFLRRDILHGCLALGPSASSARIHHVCLNGCSSGVNLFSDAPSRFSSELQRLPVFNLSFTELALLSGNPERQGRAREDFYPSSRRIISGDRAGSKISLWSVYDRMLTHKTKPREFSPGSDEKYQDLLPAKATTNHASQTDQAAAQ